MVRNSLWVRLALAGAAICALAIVAVAVFSFVGLARASGYHWERATPESQGLDGDRLDTLQRDLEARGTTVFLVVRNGGIVHEWYSGGYYSNSIRGTLKDLVRRFVPGWGYENQKQNLGSMAKLLTTSMILTSAVQDGHLKLDDPAWMYIPAWKDDPVRSQITIRHLATQTSGIENVKYPDEQEDWKGEFSRNVDARFSLANTTAPVLHEPGTHYVYSSTGYYSLHYALSASLGESAQPDIRELLRDEIMQPLGAPDSAWEVSDGQSYPVDGMQLYAISAEYTARTIAQVGQLLLDSGRWQDQQLLAPELVKEMVSYGGGPNLERPENTPATTVGGWSNYDGIWPQLPRDALVAAGADHKILLIVPSLDLLVIRMGSPLDNSAAWTASGGPYFETLEGDIFNPLMDAVADTSVSGDVN